MSKEFRPVSVPLITVDPYFSIWSFADELPREVTRHWTGRRNAMTGAVKIDGKSFIFMGNNSCSLLPNRKNTKKFGFGLAKTPFAN